MRFTSVLLLAGVFAVNTWAANEAPSLEKQAIRAQLSPRNYTSLAAEIGAKIDRIAVREGQAFKSGQTLIKLDCALQVAQSQRAQAALGAADKLVVANRRLVELKSVGRLELDTAEAELAKARADVALTDATLSKCNITAPFSGRVTEQKMREKQFVQAGQPIIDIIDDSSLELEFIVPSRWLVWLKPGHRFQVHIDETGQTYPAKITSLGAQVDPVSQSIKIAATIDGRFPQLMAGMSGRIELAEPGTVAGGATTH